MLVNGVVGRRIRPVFLIATIIPASLMAHGAFSTARADNAESSTSSTHSASSGGDGSSVAGGGANESSNASASSNNANGNAVVVVGSSSSQNGGNGNSAANADVNSDASASSGPAENTATANASVTLRGGAEQTSASANAGNSSSASATATSGAAPRASASTSNGGYAAAAAGGSAVAYQPGQSSSTYRRGNTTVVIAYTDQGSFSMAISDAASARAMAGTTNETAALSQGRVRAILKSSTYAEAYADMDFAWAEAWAEGDTESGTNDGFSKASGRSYAWARASRNGDYAVVDTQVSRYSNGNKQFESKCSNRSKSKNIVSCSSPGGTSARFSHTANDLSGFVVVGQKRLRAKPARKFMRFGDDDDIAAVASRRVEHFGVVTKVSLPKRKCASGKNCAKTVRLAGKFGVVVKENSALSVPKAHIRKKRWTTVGDYIDKSDVAPTRKAKSKPSIKVVKVSKKAKRGFDFENS
jgi:hypothetical protein